MIPEVHFDMFTNGQMGGEMGDMMPDASMPFDAGLLRPFYNTDSRLGPKGPMVKMNTWQKRYKKDANDQVVTNSEGAPIEYFVHQYVPIKDLMNRGLHTPVWNATSLRLDEWKRIQDRVVLTARKRLKAWNDLASRNSISGFDGMGTTIFEHETMSDPGSATVDMDGLSEGNADSPRFQLQGHPLPVTHSPFHYPRRQLAASRKRGQPLNVASSEASARRVAETLEETLIGTVTGITYGASTEYGRTSQAYGYTNFPGRVTKTDMTTPTGTNGDAVHGSWLALLESMRAQNFYGPFKAYVSTDYTQYLDRTFSTSEPSAGTLRDMLLKMDDLESIDRLDYLTNTFTVILVQMDEDVAQIINGGDIQVIQWESAGGFRINFKVFTIQAPLLKDDFSGQCGIGHGTTA
jgi:hypothetical protein